MRISHRQHSNHELRYVDRIVEVEKIKHVQAQPEKTDLTPVYAHVSKHEEYLRALSERIDRMAPIYAELEMQRQALVALKTQRDIDRSRRLMFMRRVKKQHDKLRQENWQLKLMCLSTAGAGLLLTLFCLIK